jgi:hypothetical protein
MRVRDGVLHVVGSCYRSVTLNVHFKSCNTQNFQRILHHRGSRFWEFGANHLKSRLQLNHVPVHEQHSAKVGKLTTTSKTLSLTRIVYS